MNALEAEKNKITCNKCILQLPNSNASLRELCDFAISFPGYKYAGGNVLELAALYERVQNLICTDYVIDHSKLHLVSVNDLRACLFWDQRAARWNGNLDIEQ
jgi:hypothetical protein